MGNIANGDLNITCFGDKQNYGRWGRLHSKVKQAYKVNRRRYNKCFKVFKTIDEVLGKICIIVVIQIQILLFLCDIQAVKVLH